ncbi:signal peptidase I [Allosphingosinicella deserti]|uniref:Signal peptidase I n=1 Tax=Allosphingosinicella deserti TaxID=2116704 RepID=A0A2P7QN33_9SPHN|nr:signal peptidase I [Sphingomonas deserti]PSJ39370.1 signal peptidase I [Sphingomonas deserti]
MSDARRGAGARIGIAALNLLVPGLGLLRLGHWKAALACALAAPVACLLLVLFYIAAPVLHFWGWAVSLGLVSLTIVLALAASIILSWRWSPLRPLERPVWQRWYAIVGLGLVAMLLVSEVAGLPRLYYRSFYIPAESMNPLLLKNDRLVADMRAREVRRGDIIVLAVGDSMYVKRVAALPGDRVAMRGGIFVLNGTPVRQRFVRQEGEYRRYAERFPGEVAEHEIYDKGEQLFDEMRERAVPPGHLFVLGDNRDMSADSRVPRAEMGVEMLPAADIRGRVLFRTYGPSGRIGESLTR